MSPLDERPATTAGTVAILSAALVVLTAALSAPQSATVALVGFGMHGLAVRRGWRFGFDLGPLVLFVAVVDGAVRSGSVELALLGSIGAVLAWDLGGTARDVGRQLGRGSRTKRLELVRIFASVTVAALAVALGYVVYAVADGGGSNAALVALVGAILFATIAVGTGVSTVRTGGGTEYREL